MNITSVMCLDTFTTLHLISFQYAQLLVWTKIIFLCVDHSSIDSTQKNDVFLLGYHMSDHFLCDHSYINTLDHGLPDIYVCNIFTICKCLNIVTVLLIWDQAGHIWHEQIISSYPTLIPDVLDHYLYSMIIRSCY